MKKFYELLGLRKKEEKLYLLSVVSGETTYEEVAGNPLSVEGAEEFEFYSTKKGKMFLVFEGITGKVISFGKSEEEAVRDLKRKLFRDGIATLSYAIAKSVFEEGLLSPAYEKRESREKRLCLVCGERESLPKESVCYECLCIKPYETIQKLLGRLEGRDFFREVCSATNSDRESEKE